jgi:hypothetical protein
MEIKVAAGIISGIINDVIDNMNRIGKLLSLYEFLKKSRELSSYSAETEDILRLSVVFIQH